MRYRVANKVAKRVALKDYPYSLATLRRANRRLDRAWSLWQRLHLTGTRPPELRGNAQLAAIGAVTAVVDALHGR